MKKITTLILTGAGLLGATAQAHNHEGSWLKHEKTRGLQVAGITGGASSATIGFAQFVDENKSWRADVGLRFTKPDGADSQFAFSLDVGYRTYVAEAGSVKAFTQPGGFLAKEATAADLMDELTLAVQYLVGAEYFVNPNFSLGASTGVALTFSNKFKQIDFGTGTSALFAAFYW
jgi:hypothetical protein